MYKIYLNFLNYKFKIQKKSFSFLNTYKTSSNQLKCPKLQIIIIKNKAMDM